MGPSVLIRPSPPHEPTPQMWARGRQSSCQREQHPLQGPARRGLGIEVGDHPTTVAPTQLCACVCFLHCARSARSAPGSAGLGPAGDGLACGCIVRCSFRFRFRRAMFPGSNPRPAWAFCPSPSAAAHPLGAVIRYMPNCPLIRLGRLALRFPAPASPLASEVDASRDGARDSVCRPSGATRSRRAPTDSVGVIADG